MKFLLILLITAVVANDTYYYQLCDRCRLQTCVVKVAPNNTMQFQSDFYELTCICDASHCGTYCNKRWRSKEDYLSCIDRGYCEMNEKEGIASNVFFMILIAYGSVLFVATCIDVIKYFLKRREQQYIELETDNNDNRQDEPKSNDILSPKNNKLEYIISFTGLIILTIVFVATYCVHRN